MTLEKAIQHYEEVAEEYEDKVKRWKGDYPVCKAIMSCQKCAAEHRQLAEWLKELKAVHDEIDDADDEDEVFVGYLRKKMRGE